MKTPPRPTATNAFQALHNLLRRFLGGKASPEKIAHDAGSYVGLFQGMIETDAPAAPVLPPVPATTADGPKPVHRPSMKSAARASGFLRLEVNDKKKATGCFLFFVDGEVLSGDIEGASEQAGFVDASFRLNPRRTDPSEGSVRRSVSAVGKLHLEARHARGAAATGENLTIRFV